MIVIDGVSYDVEFSELSREKRTEYKYEVTTEDGRLHKEVRAVYWDYSLSLGNVDEVAYDDLMHVLEQADEVTVELPDSRAGVRTFTGRFVDIGDELLAEDADGNRLWDNLELEFEGSIPV